MGGKKTNKRDELFMEILQKFFGVKFIDVDGEIIKNDDSTDDRDKKDKKGDL